MKPDMHRKTRTILFSIFVLLFFLLAPLIVLYTAGFRYNVRLGVVQQTASLDISTRPRGATISLNGRAFERTPHIFKRIFPGIYDIRLEREGYHPWTGRIELPSGGSALLQGITLLESASPEVFASIPNTAEQFEAFEETIAYLTEEAGWLEGWIFNAEENELTNSFRVSSRDGATIHLSHDGEAIAFALQNDLKVFTSSGEELPLQTLPLSLANVYWHPETSDTLYIESARAKYELSTRTGELEEIDPATLFRNDTGRFFIDEASQFLAKETASGIEFLAKMPEISLELERATPSFLLFSAGNGDWYAFPRFEGGPMRSISARASSVRGDALVYTNGTDLIELNLSSGNEIILARLSERIRSIAWPDNLDYLLFETERGLFAIETVKRSESRQIILLAEETNASELWTVENGRAARYVERSQDGSLTLFELPLR
jgi:hypothetical protein